MGFGLEGQWNDLVGPVGLEVAREEGDDSGCEFRWWSGDSPWVGGFGFGDQWYEVEVEGGFGGLK